MTTSPPPPFPPPRAVMRFVAQTLHSLGNTLHLAKLLHTGLDDGELVDLGVAAEYAQRASIQLFRRFGSGIEPAALEMLRYERMELLECVRLLSEGLQKGTMPVAFTLPMFLESVDEHLRKVEVVTDAKAAEDLEREIRALVQGSL